MWGAVVMIGVSLIDGYLSSKQNDAATTVAADQAYNNWVFNQNYTNLAKSQQQEKWNLAGLERSTVMQAAQRTQNFENMKIQFDSWARESQIQAHESQVQAKVEMQNTEIQKIEDSMQVMEMQGKADHVMRSEAYNKLAQTQMVQVAYSGRVSGEGSVDAIMTKSQEDYRWDQAWNADLLTISKASLEADQTNIARAGYLELRNTAKNSATERYLSSAQSKISQIGSDMNYYNTSDQVNLMYQSAVFDREYSNKLIDLEQQKQAMNLDQSQQNIGLLNYNNSINTQKSYVNAAGKYIGQMDT